MNGLKTMKQSGKLSSDERFRLAWLEDAVEREAQRAESIRKSSNLGKRFERRTFDTFDASKNPKAYELCLAYANRESFDDECNSLLLIGSYGIGKTHLAAAISNTLIARGIPVLFDTFSGHLAKLRGEFDTSESRYMQTMKDIPMLILDDVGKEKQTEWTTQVMYDIINYRYEHMTPIVITSNLERKALEAYLGGACFSRICEMCQGIVMRGEDQRRKMLSERR